MNDTYKFYIENIKPLEKKYTRMCILYSLFKLKYFENKKNLYNSILIYYYQTLLDNPQKLNDITKHFD